ncbi:MAG: kinase-like domain-containing protein [Piptocephalis tieghemiana]|nr:MAG: kinase-like domain-containing protein [Piptocephalis tieghemiana]
MKSIIHASHTPLPLLLLSALLLILNSMPSSHAMPGLKDHLGSFSSLSQSSNSIPHDLSLDLPHCSILLDHEKFSRILPKHRLAYTDKCPLEAFEKVMEMRQEQEQDQEQKQGKPQEKPRYIRNQSFSSYGSSSGSSGTLVLPYTTHGSLTGDVSGSVRNGKWYGGNGYVEKQVAIKQFWKGSPDNLVRFKRALRGMMIGHDLAPDAVTRVLDVYLDDPDYWIIIMEKGIGSMHRWVLKMTGADDPKVPNNPKDIISERTLFDLLKPIIKALRVFYEKGYVHGSVNPDNIIIFRENNSYTAKLSGFSTFRSKEDDDFDAKLGGDILYTPQVMREKKGKITPKHIMSLDAYGLAVTMQEALSAPGGPGFAGWSQGKTSPTDMLHRKSLSKPLAEILIRELGYNKFFKKQNWHKNPCTIKDLKKEFEKWEKHVQTLPPVVFPREPVMVR